MPALPISQAVRRAVTATAVPTVRAPVPKTIPANLEPYRDMLGGVGRIKAAFSDEPSQGTGFHIGDGYVLTAGHTVLEGKKAVGRLTLEWASLPGNPSPLRSTVVEVLGHKSIGNVADFSLVRVSPAPATKLALDFGGGEVGRSVAILGHPAGGPLEATLPAEIRRGESEFKGGRTFFHKAAGVGGFSGGPVFDATRHRVVGIHNSSSGQAMSLFHPELFKQLRLLGFVPSGTQIPPAPRAGG